MEKATSLKEVARALGVSTASISNAFNRPDQLSKSLRETILQQCKDMGYSGPSFAARSLRSGTTDVICVMLTDELSYSFSDPMATLFLEGISDVLAENQKQLLLLSSTQTSDAQSRAETMPDGYIFYGTPRSEAFSRVLNLNKPCVCVDFIHENLPSLNIDNYGACYEIACHAVSSPADNVAVIGMRVLVSQTIKRLSKQDFGLASKDIIWARLLGFVAGAKDKDSLIEPDNIIHLPINTTKYAETAARLLLMQENRPNVILCMSDVIATAVIRVAKELSISIPQDLRVTGFDDIEAASQIENGLTTISQDGREKGRLATQMLLSSAQDQRLFPYEMRLRGSTKAK